MITVKNLSKIQVPSDLYQTSYRDYILAVVDQKKFSTFSAMHSDSIVHAHCTHAACTLLSHFIHR